MRESYWLVAGRNILFCQELDKILSSFNEAGLEAILLKGISLIHTIYPDIGLRPMSDVDILVRKDELSLVENKLKELGYSNSSAYPEDFYKDGVVVDVHSELISTTRIKSREKSHCIDLEEIWQSSFPVEINGKKARMLSLEHNLLDLCLHLVFHHGLKGLMWFTDIARFIEYYKSKINWDKFIQQSWDYKVNKPVFYTLFYVKNVLKQDLPEFVLQGLKPERINFLERKVFDWAVTGEAIQNIRLFFAFANMERFRDKLLFLKEVCLLTPKVIKARYNLNSDMLIPIYYCIYFKSILVSIFKLSKKLAFSACNFNTELNYLAGEPFLMQV